MHAPSKARKGERGEREGPLPPCVGPSKIIVFFALKIAHWYEKRVKTHYAEIGSSKHGGDTATDP